MHTLQLAANDDVKLGPRWAWSSSIHFTIDPRVTTSLSHWRVRPRSSSATSSIRRDWTTVRSDQIASDRLQQPHQVCDSLRDRKHCWNNYVILSVEFVLRILTKR